MGAPLESSFYYQAMTDAGKKKSGVRTAVDEGDLATRLQKEKLLLLKATRLPIGQSPPQASRGRPQPAQ